MLEHMLATTVREALAECTDDDSDDDDDDDGEEVENKEKVKVQVKPDVDSKKEDPYRGRVLWHRLQLPTKADHPKFFSLALQASRRLPTLSSPPLLPRLTPTISPGLQLASLLLTMTILPLTLPPLIPPKRRPTRTSSIRNNRCRSANFNTRRTCKPADSSMRRK